MDMHYHKNPCPRDNEIYNFSRLFISHHQNILSLSYLCLRLKKKIFKEAMHFHCITQYIYGHALAHAPMIFTI